MILCIRLILLYIINSCPRRSAPFPDRLSNPNPLSSIIRRRLAPIVAVAPLQAARRRVGRRAPGCGYRPHGRHGDALRCRRAQRRLGAGLNLGTGRAKEAEKAPEPKTVGHGLGPARVALAKFRSACGAGRHVAGDTNGLRN